jgi:Protein of unknown function (DUF3618)
MGAREDAMSIDSQDDRLLLPGPAPVVDGSYDASGKSADQIEQDIGETRAQLGEILDELERKLAPRQLLERGVDMLKDTVSGETGGFGESLRGHPVPLALVGIGVGWMLMSMTGRGGRLGDRVSGALHDAGERAGALAGQVRDKVAGMTSSASAADDIIPAPYPTESAGYAYARQKSGTPMGEARGVLQDKTRGARAAGNAALDQASAYAGKAGDALHDTRDRLSRLIDDHPIAVGALGVLAGAVMAALLPRSDAEERLVGPASEQLRDGAAQLGREAVDRAHQVAERTVDAAVDAVRQAVNEVGDATQPKSSASV